MARRQPEPSRLARSWRWLTRHEDRIFQVLLLLALAANIAPLLVTEFLPFSDLPGHLGVVGANLHAHRPAAHIARFYSLNPHFGPNSLEFGLLLVLGKVMSLTSAARILVGLSVTLLPLSFLALLSAFRRSPWLVFLSLPFAYPRILWYGFLGASLGISLMFLTLAAARTAATDNSPWMALAASALCFLSGLAHPFFLAATLGLFLLVWIGSILEHPTSWKTWAVGLVPLPSLLIFGHWFLAMAAGKASTGAHKHQSLWKHILSKRPALPIYKKWLEQWSIHAFKDRGLEQTILLILSATVAILFLSALWTWTKALWHRLQAAMAEKTRSAKGMTKDSHPESNASPDQDEGPNQDDQPDQPDQPNQPAQPNQDDQRHTDGHAGMSSSLRRRLLANLIPAALLAATAAAYLSLPGVITYPVYWWAVAQRLVTPLLLLLVLALPSAVSPKLARLAGLAGLVVGLVYASFLTKDFRQHFARREMAGFHELIDKIPPGKRLCALYDDREQHYAHFPLHFASAYYVALRGGFAMPFPRVAGYKSIAWAYPDKVPPSPPWGKLRAFSRRRYSRFYDYFLVKKNADGKTRWEGRLPKRCFQIVAAKGLWVLLKKTSAPGC